MEQRSKIPAYIFFALAAFLATGGPSLSQHPALPSLDLKSLLGKLPGGMYLEGSFQVPLSGGDSAVDISPLVGYRFNKHFAVGIGATYRSRPLPTGRATQWGGRSHFRYLPDTLLPFLQLEWEGMTPMDSLGSGEKGKGWGNTLRIGMGYNLPLGNGTGLQLQIMRDLAWGGNYTRNQKPWSLRVGMTTDVGRKTGQGEGEVPGKWGFEGNFGGRYGQPDWELYAAPAVSYTLGRNASIGAGPSVLYSEKGGKRASEWGGIGYMRFQATQWPVYAQLEYNGRLDAGNGDTRKKWASYLLAGGGIMKPMGNGRYMGITALRTLAGPGAGGWAIRVGLVNPVPAKGPAGGKGKASGDISEKRPKENKPDSANIWRRFYIEGSMGLAIGGENGGVDFSPVLGYRTDMGLSVALGPSYARKRDTEGALSESLGARGYLRYGKKGLPFVQTEYEAGKGDGGQWGTALRLGAGHSLRLGPLGTATATVMRDIARTGEPLGASKWAVRVGFQTGLRPDGKTAAQNGKDYLQKLGKGALDSLGLNPVPHKRDSLGIKTEKFYFEPNISGFPGNGQSVEAAPFLGYQWDPHWSLAVGAGYRSVQKGRPQYSGRAYLRYIARPNLPFVQLEYARLSAPSDSIGNRKNSLLFGVGGPVKLKAGTALTVSLSRDLLWKKSESTGPWTVRIGVTAQGKGTGKGSAEGKRDESGKEKLDPFRPSYVEGNIGVVPGPPHGFEFSPLYGYRVTRWYSVALGPSIRTGGGSRPVYGGRAYLRCSPDGQLFHAQLEWESLNMPRPSGNGPEGREWRSSVLAGGGLVLPVGNRSAFRITVLKRLEGGTATRGDGWTARFSFAI